MGVTRWRDIEVVTDLRADLGEGPLWDHRIQRVMWVDILGRQIHTTDPESGSTASVATDTEVGVVGLADDDHYLVANRRGFGRFDGQHIVQTNEVLTDPGQRMNDGGVDPVGRFIAGSITDDRSPTGALYSRNTHGEVSTLFGGVTVSNGLAWSADGRRLFYVDSPLQSIDVMDYDVGSGTASDRETWLAIPAAAGTPDGLTIDAEGCLWLALWGGSSVQRFSPDGLLIGVVELPVSRVTSCAFGGPDLDRLFITTAAVGASDHDPPNPLDGALFVIETGCVGVLSPLAGVSG